MMTDEELIKLAEKQALKDIHEDNLRFSKKMDKYVRVTDNENPGISFKGVRLYK